MKAFLEIIGTLLLSLLAVLFIATLVSINVEAKSIPPDTDYHNNAASEEISRQTRCEHRLGYWDDRLKQCLDQPLTDNQETYLQGYVAGMQQKEMHYAGR